MFEGQKALVDLWLKGGGSDNLIDQVFFARFLFDRNCFAWLNLENVFLMLAFEAQKSNILPGFAS